MIGCPQLAADLVGLKVDVIADGHLPSGISGEKRDLYDPDRLHYRRRPGRAGPSRQPRPTGRQPHGLHQPHRRTDAQAARPAVRASSLRRRDSPAGEPNNSNTSVSLETYSKQLTGRGCSSSLS